MTTSRIAIAACLGAVLAAPSRPVALGEHVPGEVLLKFRADAAPERRGAAMAARAHAAVADLHDDWVHVRVRPGEAVEDALAAYAADPAVEWAQPNYVYRIAVAPDDFDYGQLWALKNTGQRVDSIVQPVSGSLYGDRTGTAGADIHIEPAWGVTTDCSGVVVAVLDTGVSYDHQDLAANMWNGGASYPNHGWDFVSGDDDPMDTNGHGTHVAGTIGAIGNNATGVAGVCWKARVMAVRVLDAVGMGTSASIRAGLDFAATHGAKVMNMSLGGGDTFDQAYSDAITGAQNAGALVVVAAGNEASHNDGTGGAVYPCNFTHPNILCVAALDQDYGLASFSNWGATSVDVGAPGANILSTWPGTHAVSTDPFDPRIAGWYGSSTTTPTGGGWAIASSAGNNYLIDPFNYGVSGALYNADTDDRVFKAFDLSGASAVTVGFAVAVDLADPDWLRIGCKASPNAGGIDPFSYGSVASEVQGVRTQRQLAAWGADLSPCMSASASVGFQLQSAPASRHYGAVIAPLTFAKLYANTTSYNTISGTSMATPVVAGVAALLRSYNPRFTYADAKNAIQQSGRTLASLAGKTTTGKAVDAMAALAYLQPPTGLGYVVH